MRTRLTSLECSGPIVPSLALRGWYFVCCGLFMVSNAARAAEFKPAAASAVEGKSFDVVVCGGTPAGVACAVRAARDGCTVLLVQHNAHIGGMMANGLMQWDALYGGHRAPIFSELLRSIEKHYAETFGPDSRDAQIVRYTQEHYPIGWVEPGLAEREFRKLVAGEARITTLLDYYPAEVASRGRLIESVTLKPMHRGESGHGGKPITVRGATFVDAMYEGDLMAAAKCAYHVGREARDVYGEPHAGKVFTNIEAVRAPQAAVEGKLNIRPYGQRQGSIDPTSPYTGDRCVQAYNMRMCVTCDPANRIMLTEPPPGYDRNEYVNYDRKSIATNPGPNQKSHMNSPILPGENHDYPEADWPTREKITQRHLNFALGLVYFLQNDESISEGKRKDYRRWGLPKDEFTDNGHVPYEMYVRETRRLIGRHVYTEHDNSLAKEYGRTPIHADSVAVTDWYMDSHSCTTDKRPGYKYDGKLILTEESRPGQIPYRALLPKELDNLLVPVCMSSTHISWGALRLEPVWMQTGEAAGLAAALAKQAKTTPGELDPQLLSRTLAERKYLISFFNDVNAADDPSYTPAVECFGTKGFFATYDAKPTEPLSEATAKVWAQGFADLKAQKLDAAALAAKVARAEDAASATTVAGDFAKLVGIEQAPQNASATITRGAALEMLWKSLR